MPRCARCHRNPRKHYCRLAIPVDVVVNYETQERRELAARSVLCIRCFHSLRSAYGGRAADGREITRVNHQLVVPVAGEPHKWQEVFENQGSGPLGDGQLCSRCGMLSCDGYCEERSDGQAAHPATGDRA